MQFNDGTSWDNKNVDNIPILSVEAIAHALSNICRYGGHVNSHYSVAQHSIAIAKLAPPKYFLEGLMHDASEAYIGDIPSPMKQRIPEIKIFEERIQKRIFEEYDLVWPIPDEVEYLDKVIAQTEMVNFFDSISPEVEQILLSYTNGTHIYFPIYELEEAWPAEKAKNEFIEEYCQCRMRSRS